MQPPDLNKPNSGSSQNPPPVPPPYGGPPQPPYGGQQQPPSYGGPVIPGAEKKLPAALCGILLGCFGVHKFILGYNTEGIIMLAGSLATCGFGAPIMGLIGLVEGIMYLTKSDQQFVQEYITNKKGWF
ncbi:hypothetical protein IAD21_03659 [Abditibacteriota bacterium]|nr:hypothetical protein IAD21_03659 [Abditibacteriota bacterium]